MNEDKKAVPMSPASASQPAMSPVSRAMTPTAPPMPPLPQHQSSHCQLKDESVSFLSRSLLPNGLHHTPPFAVQQHLYRHQNVPPSSSPSSVYPLSVEEIIARVNANNANMGVGGGGSGGGGLQSRELVSPQPPRYDVLPHPIGIPQPTDVTALGLEVDYNRPHIQHQQLYHSPHGYHSPLGYNSPSIPNSPFVQNSPYVPSPVSQHHHVTSYSLQQQQQHLLEQLHKLQQQQRSQPTTPAVYQHHYHSQHESGKHLEPNNAHNQNHVNGNFEMPRQQLQKQLEQPSYTSPMSGALSPDKPQSRAMSVSNVARTLSGSFSHENNRNSSSLSNAPGETTTKPKFSLEEIRKATQAFNLEKGIRSVDTAVAQRKAMHERVEQQKQLEQEARGASYRPGKIPALRYHVDRSTGQFSNPNSIIRQKAKKVTNSQLMFSVNAVPGKTDDEDVPVSKYDTQKPEYRSIVRDELTKENSLLDNQDLSIDMHRQIARHETIKFGNRDWGVNRNGFNRLRASTPSPAFGSRRL